ncbi:MAG: hypothetical protein R3E13_04025 [Alphaproteobacteria bacterium]
MMNRSFLIVSCALALTTPQTVNAQGLFDKIDRIVSDVESSINRTERTIDRAEGTASRLNDKIPQAGAEEAPAQNAGISAEEQRILDRARQIEEERTLREAEQIRQRSAARNNAVRSREYRR